MKRDATADTAGNKPAPLQEWQRDAIAAEPPGFMRDVVRDAFNGISRSASMIPDRLRLEDGPRRPSGGTAPITQPPGIDYIDQMCEAQSRADRAAAIQQRIEAAWIESHSDKGPRIETEWNPFDAKNMKR